MIEFLQTDIGKWALMNLSVGIALMWSFGMGFRERREDRKAREAGAKACHEEQRIASKAIGAAAESIGGIKAATEAQNARIASLEQTLAQNSLMVAQCMKKDPGA